MIDPPEGSIPLTRRADAPVAARRCPATPGSTTVGTSAAAGDSPRAPAPVADADLLRAHLEGDPQSFNELIRRHRTLLRIVALRVLENHHDADDAVQDGLLRAFRGAHTYAGRSSVGAWLRTIIENTARTAVRNRQRAQLRVWSSLSGRVVAVVTMNAMSASLIRRGRPPAH
ncbi:MULTISPECIES: sigma factor [unclassified Pseudonocardia]|uniref:RNA polymerase sigma factor n=1 Tax=unclassified Pseudonocardia TaxID=2619320 RepID=UPI0009F9748D